MEGKGGSEKSILQPDFERKKILHRNACPAVALYVRGKILSPVVLKKEFLRKPNHPYPPFPPQTQMICPLFRLSQSPSPVSVVWCRSALT